MKEVKYPDIPNDTGIDLVIKGNYRELFEIMERKFGNKLSVYDYHNYYISILTLKIKIFISSHMADIIYREEPADIKKVISFIDEEIEELNSIFKDFAGKAEKQNFKAFNVFNDMVKNILERKILKIIISCKH